MKKIIFLIFLVAGFAAGTSAQILKPVKWQITQKKVSEGVFDIICTATIEDTWHLYDSQLPKDGPVPTTFNIDEDETSGIEKVGGFKATTSPQVEHSEAFDMDVKYFKDKVTFVQRVKLTAPKGTLVGHVEFMACCGGQCIPPAEADFKFEFSK